MTFWSNWSTLYRGIFIAVVFLAVLEYFYAPLDLRGWEIFAASNVTKQVQCTYTTR